MPSSCERALDRLADGEITFTRAADLAEMSAWELATLIDDRDIAWIPSDSLETDLEEL